MEAVSQNCEGCSDGLVFRQGVMYRCRCPAGEKHAGPLYWPSDRDKKRPFEIPLVPPVTRGKGCRGFDLAAGNER